MEFCTKSNLIATENVYLALRPFLNRSYFESGKTVQTWEVRLQQSKNTSGNFNPFYGKTHSKEVIDRIREQHPLTLKVYAYNEDYTSIMSEGTDPKPLVYLSRTLAGLRNETQRRAISKAVLQGHITKEKIIYSPLAPIYNPRLDK